MPDGCLFEGKAGRQCLPAEDMALADQGEPVGLPCATRGQVRKLASKMMQSMTNPTAKGRKPPGW